MDIEYQTALERIVFLLTCTHPGVEKPNRPQMALCELVGLLFNRNPVSVMQDVDDLMDKRQRP